MAIRFSGDTFGTRILVCNIINVVHVSATSFREEKQYSPFGLSELKKCTILLRQPLTAIGDDDVFARRYDYARRRRRRRRYPVRRKRFHGGGGDTSAKIKLRAPGGHAANDGRETARVCPETIVSRNDANRIHDNTRNFY